jgi:hypothetical protein
MTDTVRTTQRLWSQEVAAARAATELEAVPTGQAGIAALTPKEVGYTFSNGRQFKDGKGPYE